MRTACATRATSVWARTATRPWTSLPTCSCQRTPCKRPTSMCRGPLSLALRRQVASFDGKVAVVFRDKGQGDRGALVVGSVGTALELSPVEYFTEKAFAPVVAGTEGHRLAIAWRSDARAGACRVRAANMGRSGIRGAEMALGLALALKKKGRSHDVAAARGHGCAPPAALAAAPAAASAALRPLSTRPRGGLGGADQGREPAVQGQAMDFG